MQSNKEKYSDLCKKDSLKIPIFMQDWWLDSVCENGVWDLVLAEEQNKVIAIWPYYIKKKNFFSIITMPPLTPFLGPLLFNNEVTKAEKKISHEKKIYTTLIQLIENNCKSESVWQLTQNLSKQVGNILPFHWKGYRTGCAITYQLEKLNSHEEIQKNYKYLIRRRLKKAKKKFNLSVISSDDIEKFLKLNEKTFARQNMVAPYSKDLIRKLDSACDLRDCRAIYSAVDDVGKIHAMVYIVFDYPNDTAYYLMSGTDPHLRHSDALSLLMDHAIRKSFEQVKVFDFEGSMIEKIEHFFSAFGASQIPYYNIQLPLNYAALFRLNLQSCLRDIKNLRSRDSSNKKSVKI